jgi:hypothetical protein
MWVGFLIPYALGCGREIAVPQAIATTCAVAVFRHLIAKRVGAKMGNLAQELDWGLCVTVLQLAIRRAHAA